MTAASDDTTIAYFLMRRRGALAIRCHACGHKDRWGSAFIARAVGRRGLGAKTDDLIDRLKCAQCDSDDMRAAVTVDPHGFACMNHLGDAQRWAAFEGWLDTLLGPAGSPAARGVIHDGGAVAEKH